MQFNVKWNSYNDFLVTIWSFKIILQISHNINAFNPWHWHECSDTFNFEWWQTYLNGQTTIKPWVWVDFMPMNTSQQVWKVYSSPLRDQMITVCWKKYCMIPVYKEGNILFYILNKIVLTRYTPKKVHRRWSLKALTTITWLCIFASYHAIFFQLCKFQLPLSHINKKLIYRLNPNKAEPRAFADFFRAISKQTTHSYNATQKATW